MHVLLPRILLNLSGRVGLAILLLSCGLETYVYLNPINIDSVKPEITLGNGYYQFSHNTDNDIDEFLGYEIFYKFYPAGTTTPFTPIEGDRASLENRYIPTLTPLSEKKFQRLRLVALDGLSAGKEIGTAPPLLPISSGEKDTGWVYRLDFRPLLNSPSEPPELVRLKADGSTIDATYRILRAPRQGSTNEETFTPLEIKVEDPDITSMGLKEFVSNRGKLAVVFVVLAYGRRMDGLYIYSNAIFLNRSSTMDDVMVIDL
ncbi:MAG: hypothetical protein SNJ78_03125 [Spirochaetales bacterium]